MKTFDFWIFFLASINLQVSNGLGILSLRLVTYSNPDGKSSDGNCCEHIFPIFGCASGDCDPSLEICIHDNTQAGTCSNLQFKAGPYDNTASISFGAKIGALDNPIQLPFQVWKSQFVVSIAVFDDDTDGGHDHIGTVTFTPSKSPGYNGTATAYTENITGGYARLNVVYDVHCRQNYFGEDCSRFCEPDNLHYICDAQGNRVCYRDGQGVTVSRALMTATFQPV
uniref:Protein jagged-1-like n=1 Tax=Crassostrea virginica TaxID=6565 RepID=A0A8B8CDG5_CRAVI|nr:protein jagged-1-like [Crassostrea virginica]